MADAADRADAEQAIYLEASINAIRAKVRSRPTGYCLNQTCGLAVVPPLLFCDGACRDAHERSSRRLQ